MLYIGTGSGRELVVLLEADKSLSDTDRALVEVFCSRLSAAFDNVILYEQLQQRQRAVWRSGSSSRTASSPSRTSGWPAQSEQLRHANGFKSEVLGTVAHDLKNPLGVILGRAEMLTELLAAKPLAKDAAAAQVDHIRHSAKRLTEHGRRPDRRRDERRARHLDPQASRSTSARSSPRSRRRTARSPSARSRRSRSARRRRSRCVGDHDRLREAVDNLVSNAIKYSPIGGRIDVAVARKRGQAAIRVKDQGPGLSPEDMSRLFGRFQRLSAKPTGGESSTGLGLSIAKRIVELHGGTIEAESEGRARARSSRFCCLPERWVEP